jgi:hypothetical protein
MVVGGTVLVTRPQAATALAARAGTGVPNLLLRAAAPVDPGGPGAADGAEAVQRALAERYWTAFVAEPLSRLQTGTTVLAGAPPAAKAGVLGSLRARVTAVGDWAVGRHGFERAVIATLALAYALPFALALVALAMLASCAQALVWLLALAGPLVAPLAVDPARRRAVLRLWLVPLAAAFALLGAASLAALVVIRAAELTQAADAYLGVLLAGSTFPVLAAALAVRHLLARRRPIARADLEAALRDREGDPDGICRYPDLGQPPEERYATVVSAIMDLHAQTLWISDGPPDANPFEEYRLR